jgi:hypothetical protein
MDQVKVEENREYHAPTKDYDEWKRVLQVDSSAFKAD